MMVALAIHSEMSVPLSRGPRRRAGAALMDANALIQSIAQSSDRQAFVKLFDHFAPRVKALLMRQGTPADLAEELAQETLLMVWRKAALFDPQRAGASTWIAAIARNLRIDAARREKRSRLPDVFDILQGEEPEQPDQVFDGSERDSRVRAALTSLSPDQLRVVQLAFMEGLSHQDVAKRLSIPLGTVKSRLRLAMARMRGSLEDLR
jgi:RNA polymerase sigma-70 factor (ECF subfamily)